MIREELSPLHTRLIPPTMPRPDGTVTLDEIDRFSRWYDAGLESLRFMLPAKLDPSVQTLPGDFPITGGIVLSIRFEGASSETDRVVADFNDRWIDGDWLWLYSSSPAGVVGFDMSEVRVDRVETDWNSQGTTSVVTLRGLMSMSWSPVPTVDDWGRPLIPKRWAVL